MIHVSDDHCEENGEIMQASADTCVDHWYLWLLLLVVEHLSSGYALDADTASEHLRSDVGYAEPNSPEWVVLCRPNESLRG
jgi:hypothetical protein